MGSSQHGSFFTIAGIDGIRHTVNAALLLDIVVAADCEQRGLGVFLPLRLDDFADAAGQKIVAAVTSGLVPDLFQNNPAEIIALYAWQDKLVDRRSF